MVAHIVLITWGYAAGRLLSAPSTLWDLTWHYPGMLLAIVGTVARVLVVATSIRAARRRLRPRARSRRKVALIGAGVGMTPLRALAEGLPYAPGDAVVLHRFTETPLFEPEFASLVRSRGLQVLNLPGHRRAAGSWLGSGVGAAGDLAALRSWVPDIAERDVYLCGPQRWTALVRRTLARAGVTTDHLHLETFAW